MTDDDGHDVSPDGRAEAWDDAIAEAVRGWDGPLVPEPVLLSGALVGFDPDDAEAVLLDPRSQLYLNGVWTSYGDATGHELPPVFHDRIDEERRDGGDRWNLAVAHACGYGWTDDDLAGPYVVRLQARPSDQDLAWAASVDEQPDDDVASDAWEVEMRAQHVDISARRTDGVLWVQVVSYGPRGACEVVLGFGDGSSVRREVALVVDEPLRFAVEGRALPVSGQLRITDRMGE
ncbi:MAG TPA: hypothetical protein PKE40_01085 [Arachnia sp.]|nr:hypothetical protein [Arachnia sp.]HMT84921.1 hypothetical protein [Arachnia sp.]